MKYKLVKHSESSNQTFKTSTTFDTLEAARAELKRWFECETADRFDDLCRENDINPDSSPLSYPADFGRYDWDGKITEITEYDEMPAKIADELGVSSAEAEAIKDLYNYLFGNKWTLDSVDNDWRNDYLGTHTWGGRDWVYYFDGVNECGIWVDSGEHLSDEEIEKYL